MDRLSPSTQRILIWWGLAFAILYGIGAAALIRLLPLPPADQSAAEVVRFYSENRQNVLLGAAVCSWSGGFLLPLSVVIMAQMTRLEKGFPFWSILQLAGGCMMTIFIVLPPILWGVAAFDVDRNPDVTQMIHQLANLAFITTDQYFVFLFVPIAVISLSNSTGVKSPFPRWFGYYTIWSVVLIEVGVAGYLTKTGPFAWNGLFVFWLPIVAFSLWLIMLATMLLRAITGQTPATMVP